MTAQSDVGRQGKIIAIGVLVTLAVIGYIVATYLSNSSRRNSQISVVTQNQRGSETEESQRYSEILSRYNQENAKEAAQTGTTYLSVLSSRKNEVPAQPTPQTAPPSEPITPTQPVRYTQQVAYRPQQQQQRPNPQVSGLLSGWVAVPHAAASVTEEEYYSSSINTQQNTAGGNRDRNGSAPQIPATVIVEDFALVPAILKTDIDTDEDSMVMAYVPSGPYQGAMVYAMGYSRVTSTVDMTFTYMRFRGQSYNITAKPVDQQTRRTTLSGEVNNRYFQRIVLPAVAAGLGRTGQLYEQANSQNIITNQGAVIQTYPTTPRASAVAGTMIGGMGNQAGQVMAQDAQRIPPKQVLIPQGTTIGIQFIGPVLSTDAINEQSGSIFQQQQAAIAAQQPQYQYQPAMPQQQVMYGGGYAGSYGYVGAPGGFTPGYYPSFTAGGNNYYPGANIYYPTPRY